MSLSKCSSFFRRDEDGCVRDVVAVPNVAQLDALVLAGEALEGEVDVRETLELQLDAETVVRILGARSRILGGAANAAELGA